MVRYRCTVCGYVHNGELPEGFVCPRCGKPASYFVREESSKSANKYAGTKTEKNLLDCFAGESQAKNKYMLFAAVAMKEGYDQIAAQLHKRVVYIVRRNGYNRINHRSVIQCRKHIIVEFACNRCYKLVTNFTYRVSVA